MKTELAIIGINDIKFILNKNDLQILSECIEPFPTIPEYKYFFNEK